MMAAEGPFLAAVIARLADPKFNLASYGVAFAFAVLMEAPVIMLMSAATALVEDSASYRRLRNFANGLNAAATGLLLLVLVPPVYQALAVSALGLPDRVVDLTYGALWLFLPWPAAIGIRRFIQGVLIRSGRTRLVALGTVVRLVAMAVAALFFAIVLGFEGAWVGAAALSTGVCAEAAAARWMARSTIRELLATPASSDRSGESLGYRQIAAFYYPLALTSLIGLAIQPMLTFFMGRAPFPVESLAVFPVVGALAFVFRALGLAYQDAAIALMGRRHEGYPQVARFATGLALAASAGLAAVAFTPLAYVWFVTLSGLTPELVSFALPAARVLAPLPALAVLLNVQRAVLMKGRRTRPITAASAIEVVVVAALFPSLAWGVGLMGVTSAFLAFLGGRVAANIYLAPKCGAVLRESSPARDDLEPDL